jgi:peptide/nickel transport system ATP-binding protein
MNELLEVKDLKIYYRNISGISKAVDGVSFWVYPGEVFGITGESGSGKSTLISGITKFIGSSMYIPEGRINFSYKEDTNYRNVNLLTLPDDELRDIRWKHISYIPQGSMNSLNPVMKIGDQMTDVIVEHSQKNKEEAMALLPDLLNAVNLHSNVLNMYPHELSGGMKQRVIIAMALALQPELIIADEPTTALDVVSQLSVLSTLLVVSKDINASLFLVTHDMAVHAQMADRIAVMYAGKIVEIGKTNDIFKEPLHPYTVGLLSSIPSIDDRRKRLEGISGIAPSSTNWPRGCRFHPRCPQVREKCKVEEPPMIKYDGGRYVACFLYGGVER